MQRNRAVFCDRDGVLIRDCGYLHDPDRIEILDGVPAAIRLLNESGFLSLVVTNQSGVARGYFSENIVQRTHAAISKRLAEAGAHIDAFYYCPHYPDAVVPAYKQDCDCRKPKPGMILRAAETWGIDLSKSFMVGDKGSDVEAGKAVGARTLLILPEGGQRTSPDQESAFTQQPDWVATDLLEAVQWILQ
ncbi:MAG TPA: HAD family hydrolase [Pyrinomonadaceae bacterium]|nr:HAD family hydrolase [Pyrinomonadaceae bacterium]